MDKVTTVTIWDVLQHALLNQPVAQNNECGKVIRADFGIPCLVKNVNHNFVFFILW